MAKLKNARKLWATIQGRANECDMEELLAACAVYLEADAEREDHVVVKALLEGAAEQCRHASMDYYCSTK